MWLTWLEHCSRDWRVAGSIPGQGMCSGCGFGPWLGPCKRQSIDVSLSHNISPSFSLLFPLSVSSGRIRKKRSRKYTGVLTQRTAGTCLTSYNSWSISCQCKHSEGAGWCETGGFFKGIVTGFLYIQSEICSIDRENDPSVSHTGEDCSDVRVQVDSTSF